MSLTSEQLKQHMVSIGLAPDEEKMEKLHEYAVILKEWNQKMNLTAIDEEEDVNEKHFLDSLLLLKNDMHGTLADVGSGAGFPGLVIAIARKDLQVSLIEPTGKRCTFLNYVKEALSLANVTVENARAEDYAKNHREMYDTVTARAVANLPVLAELCIPLVKSGGQFLAMKGSQGREEAVQAERAFQVLGMEKPVVEDYALPSRDERTIVKARKVRNTPMQYPRPYARIKKKPL